MSTLSNRTTRLSKLCSFGWCSFRHVEHPACVVLAVEFVPHTVSGLSLSDAKEKPQCYDVVSRCSALGRQMIGFESDEAILEKLRERLRRMTDEELIRFGKDVRRLAENPFQRQLDEARAEWKRRKKREVFCTLAIIVLCRASRRNFRCTRVSFGPGRTKTLLTRSSNRESICPSRVSQPYTFARRYKRELRVLCISLA
jgi:hypothetical protein